MIRWTLCLASLLLLPAYAQIPRPLVVNAVTDRYRPLALDQQKLTGILAERMRAAREGYLEHVNGKALLAPFRAGPGASEALQDEPGRFLEAAANAYDYSRDPNLKKAMDAVEKELLAVQSADGYLGANPGEHRWSSPEIWSQRCNLLGLNAYYRVTGDEAAFSASKKSADLLVKTFSKLAGKPERALSAVIEPLVFLYRYSDDSRYLTLAKNFASAAGFTAEDKAPLQERIAAMIGCLELYRATGDNSYFGQVASAWQGLRADPFFLSSSNGSLRAGELPEMADACSTALWVRLTLNLLRLTGEPRYGEELERIIYNQLFAAQDARTGKTFSTVPFNGEKSAALSAGGCVASEAMGIAEIPSASWGRYGNGIAMILYAGGHATFQLRRRGTIQLYAEATYPSTGEILLHVEPSHNIQFPLRLRVPEWTTRFVADIGGSHLIGKPGDFLTIIREWKRGDTVKLAIDMSVHTIRSGVSSRNEVAIQRGPQVLALEAALNPEIKDLAAAGPVSTAPAQLELTALDAKFPADWAGNQAYALAGEYQGKARRLILAPFADALNYAVFMKAPAAVSGATAPER